jgi:iron(III) transport system substrate-binding protein
MTQNIKYYFFVFSLATFLLVGCGESDTAEDMDSVDSTQVVNVYSHRSYDVDKMLYEAFEEETGIKVNVISDDADKLIAKLQMASASTDADVLITVDAARLYRAYEAGLFDTLALATIQDNIGEGLVGAENSWVALTKRARVVAYDPEKVEPEEIATWEDLTKPRFKGEIAVRSSDNVYNQSLLSAIISSKGEEYAKQWAEGIVENMVADPAGNDRDQIRKVASGEASVAIVNTYYYGLLGASEDPADREVAEKVALAFPEVPGGGVHINVSGIGVLKNSPNPENAMRLIEYLTSGTAQNIYSEQNFEYPANPNAIMNKEIATWGDFEPDDTPLDSLGYYNKQAVMIFDQVGWK